MLSWKVLLPIASFLLIVFLLTSVTRNNGSTVVVPSASTAAAASEVQPKTHPSKLFGSFVKLKEGTPVVYHFLILFGGGLKSKLEIRKGSTQGHLIDNSRAREVFQDRLYTNWTPWYIEVRGEGELQLDMQKADLRLIAAEAGVFMIVSPPGVPMPAQGIDTVLIVTEGGGMLMSYPGPDGTGFAGTCTPGLKPLGDDDAPVLDGNEADRIIRSRWF